MGEEKGEYPREAGIYKLLCHVNNKIYIGKANNLRIRLKYHKNSINHNDDRKYVIRNAIKKHGWETFSVEILEIIKDFDKNRDKEKILRLESSYIKKYKSTDPNIGYNVCEFSTDRTGAILSEEHKQKISNAHKGKPKSRESIEKMRKSKIGISTGPHSKESIEKMRNSKLGRKRPEFSKEWKENIGKGHRGLLHTEESKEKIRQAHLGKPKSKESIEKMRKSLTGRKHSEDTKQKMSDSQKGKKMSKEATEKSRQASIGRKHSQESKEKMRESQKGNKNASGKRSEESKQKMREARLAYLAKKKDSDQIQ